MPRTTITLVAVLAMLLLAPAAGAIAQATAEDLATAEHLEADASIVDAAPTSWERLEVAPDGLRLRVFFSTGASACYGLARIDVDRDGEVPVVTVWTGLRADAASRTCDAMNYDYYSDVDLDAPLILDGNEDTAGALSPSAAIGPGISIADVDDAPAGEILLVNGSLLTGPDGEVRLWEALAESDPPQGAGRSLLVEGLDEDGVDWRASDGVRWSDGVQLLGRVRDGILVIEPLAR